MKLFPPPATDLAVKVDRLAVVYFTIFALMTLAVLFALVYFSIKYRRGSRASRENRPKNSRKLEVAAITSILLIGITNFVFAGRLYYQEVVPPKGALEVYVVAKQWMWTFYPPSGRENINELTVPLGKPVHLLMTSTDVIHSFFVPSFRVKQDVLPGRYTSLWFQANTLGTFPVLCTQYCGLAHSEMRAVVHVVSEEEYEKGFTPNRFSESLANEGANIYNAKGCVTCHSTTLAPHFRDLFGSNVLLNNGKMVSADEEYIRRSLYFPAQEVVRGYQPIMPSFQGNLSEHELLALIAYIKSQKEEKPHAP